MKSIFVALIGSAVAVKLDVQGGPPYPDWPVWNEQMPSASGFVQKSACSASDIKVGVTCVKGE